MEKLKTAVVALSVASLVFLPMSNARAATVQETVAQIQALLAQIEKLQAELTALKGEVRSVIKSGLTEGMTDADIEKIQEILATDPSIYPEGKVTGYYGPLTREALKRFQAKNQLTITGAIDAETRAVLEAYLSETFGSQIPAGLLTAPGIAKKVELRVKSACERSVDLSGTGPLCKKFKLEIESEDEDDSYTSGGDDEDDSYSQGRDDEDEYEDEDEDEDDDSDDDDDSSSVSTSTQTTPSGTGTTVSMSAVATHDTAADCWVVVNGKAYDVTAYIPYHPGGTSAITSRCGTDASTKFNSIHGSSAKNKLNSYFVGTVQ